MGIATTKIISFKSNIAKGFTLIELVLVIMLLGIMAVGIAGFIKLTAQTYVNVAQRDELIASARFAVERLNREIRNAVPNSVRVKNQAGFNCIEFVPILASTTYTEIAVAPEASSNTLTVIPFLGEDGNDYQCGAGCQDVVIVYPTNSDDVYSDSTDNAGKLFGLQTVVQTSASQWTLTLDHAADVNGDRFESDSPTERLYVAKSPVSYCTFSNALYRFDNYTIDDGNYIFPPTQPDLMAENLAAFDGANSSFTINEATLQRNAQVQLKLHFIRDDEDIVFNNDVHLVNIP